MSKTKTNKTRRALNALRNELGEELVTTGSTTIVAREIIEAATEGFSFKEIIEGVAQLCDEYSAQAQRNRLHNSMVEHWARNAALIRATMDETAFDVPAPLSLPELVEVRRGLELMQEAHKEPETVQQRVDAGYRKDALCKVQQLIDNEMRVREAMRVQDES